MATTTTTKPRLTLGNIERQFATEDACKAMLAKLRWPNGTQCPRCASPKVYQLAEGFRWKCKGCNKNGYRFSVLTGTVFENTNVPLKTWFRVAFLMVSSKKGISALQVHRMIDPVRGSKGSYKTAWYMCHRLRAAMQDGDLAKLTGIVEVDETFVGGKAKNAHKGNRGKGYAGGVPPKTPVIGAIGRRGNVVAQVIDEVDRKTMQDFVQATVDTSVTLVATDEAAGYDRLGKLGYSHESVNHSKGEYVRGLVHTASIDSFWSLLKRGIIGSFHHVRRKMPKSRGVAAQSTIDHCPCCDWDMPGGFPGNRHDFLHRPFGSWPHQLQLSNESAIG